MRLIDLTGKRFERLVVLHRASPSKSTTWMCQCDCGVLKSICGEELRRGSTLSCGCFARDNTAKRSTIHGECRNGKSSSEYKAWGSAKERVLNPKHPAYKNYGERGIMICDRWLNSFENFFRDMGRKPTVKHTLERVDVNGNYEPSNCVWATQKEQALNRRNNRRITFRDRTMTVKEWAEELRLNPNLVHMRLHYGWSPEKALTTPLNKNRSFLGRSGRKKKNSHE